MYRTFEYLSVCIKCINKDLFICMISTDVMYVQSNIILETNILADTFFLFIRISFEVIMQPIKKYIFSVIM